MRLQHVDPYGNIPQLVCRSKEEHFTGDLHDFCRRFNYLIVQKRCLLGRWYLHILCIRVLLCLYVGHAHYEVAFSHTNSYHYLA